MLPEIIRDRIHVVLVEPENSVNIGAVARAMMNLGFRNLRLVAPVHFERERAQITARLAEPLLDAVRVYETLAEAVADMEEVVGLSLRPGRSAVHFVTLPEWSQQLSDAPLRRTALVFGPENNGLRQEHLNLCRWVVRIPSDEAFSAFNLAQSVLLVLYEITRSLSVAPESAPPTDRTPSAAPTWNEFYQLDRLLNAVMTASGFIREGSPAGAPEVVRTLLRRAEPNTREIAVLLALFGRLQAALDRQTNPDDSGN